MKDKQLSPGAVIGVVVALLVLVGAWFALGTRGPSGEVDLKKVDLKDEEPLKPGQPGYRERTTDPPTR